MTPIAATAAVATAVSPSHQTTASPDTAPALIRAAGLLLPHLEAGRAIDAHALRAAMEQAFGGSDAEGAWSWKQAYDACEAAQVLFLRKFGPAIRARAATPAAQLAMLGKLAACCPRTPAAPRRARPSSNSRRRSRSALSPVSRPRSRRAISCWSRRPAPACSPSSPRWPAHRLSSTSLPNSRAGLLDQLFPGVSVTRFDAAHIHDHLDAGLRPSVVLMNPPFSAAAHVEGRVADAALRHVGSALARLAEGGRLVAITGANLSPDNPAWREDFIRLQERGRVVFSAAIDGRVYARHGTTHRHAPHRDRPRAGRESGGVSGCARHGARRRHAARLGDPPRSGEAAGRDLVREPCGGAAPRVPAKTGDADAPARPRGRARQLGARSGCGGGARLRGLRLDAAPRWCVLHQRGALRRLRAAVDPHSGREAAPDPARAIGRDGVGRAAQARPTGRICRRPSSPTGFCPTPSSKA